MPHSGHSQSLPVTPSHVLLNWGRGKFGPVRDQLTWASFDKQNLKIDAAAIHDDDKVLLLNSTISKFIMILLDQHVVYNIYKPPVCLKNQNMSTPRTHTSVFAWQFIQTLAHVSPKWKHLGPTHQCSQYIDPCHYICKPQIILTMNLMKPINFASWAELDTTNHVFVLE